MITAMLIAVSLTTGYLVALGLSMATTFGITKSAPNLVLKDFRLKGGYKLLQEVAWLACVTVGAYLSAVVATPTMHPIFTGTLLAGVLVVVPWTNAWETWQKGLGHQLLMSVLSIAGVGVGYYLALR
jgi:hypothetical protein